LNGHHLIPYSVYGSLEIEKVTILAKQMFPQILKMAFQLGRYGGLSERYIGRKRETVLYVY